ncbi:Undecaprenyl-diphosphatase [Candidatus Thermoflexus japonica]|uniref:Undecaprenyl-diphosphatase n=1 Tax=Candidatus Thermoflexus japonica TaxID=2035417 RepID=A0A2H5Y5P6_9CHLR|nr:Undecaprenyl-diphosphatase [Candidatus Thermoflexus japonica]
MTWFQALVLGIVQGLTEYLPVSSSAHLVLVPWLLGWRNDERLVFPFDVLVQWGTLVPVLIYFHRDLWAILAGGWEGIRRGSPFATPEGRLGGWILLATLPAAVLGMLFKKPIEAVFLQPVLTGVLLFGTAGLLWLGEHFGRGERDLGRMTARDALVIGFAQALALLPGISRSGSTIAAGLGRGFLRPEAARFSFLLSIPALLGAGLVALRDLYTVGVPPEALIPILIGFFSSALSGYFAIWGLMRMVRRRSLRPFAVYCAGVGVLTLVLFLFRG